MRRRGTTQSDGRRRRPPRSACRCSRCTRRCSARSAARSSASTASSSGAQFLQIVSDPLRYGWLQPFSALILAIDDTLDVKDGDEDEIATPEELLDRARELLLPPKADTPFGRRYLSLMQTEPELVLAHAAVARLLR